MQARRLEPKRLHYMDRLHSLSLLPSKTILLALLPLAGACDSASKKSDETAPPARYAAVTQKAEVSESDLDGFCDARPSQELVLPPLESPAPKLTAPTWVNVWATWCKSCVDEIPMIEEWKKTHGFDILYVSADEEAEARSDFAKKHPSFPKTKRMASPDGLGEWAQKTGLDAGAGLPIHLFVDHERKVKCVRAGAILPHHQAMVTHLLAK